MKSIESQDWVQILVFLMTNIESQDWVQILKPIFWGVMSCILKKVPKFRKNFLLPSSRLKMNSESNYIRQYYESYV